ncbi:protein translocase subunit SecF [Clostridium sp. B9]|uniref:protein translocase subunit SecF n=1 Tax=Clostridium sp. B9 TaxID=3423224 RepID=UPI003D2F21A5
MLKIVEKKKIWFTISILIIAIGLGFMFTKGMNFGIDFKGGTQVVIDMGKEFSKADVDKIVDEYSKDAVTNTVNGTQLEVKARELDTTQVDEMFKALQEKYDLKDDALLSQNEIGASVGKELTQNAIIAIIIAIICMLIYVIIRFEFSFGVAAIIALLHDVLITISVYAIFGITINTPFIAAILTIVGYSINDTIVIFDRIRENRKKLRGKSPEEVADISITQTMSRSINTTLTTLVTIVCVYIFVPTVRDFAFPLIVGIASGACSSIFIASPIWCMITNHQKKKKARNK